MKRVLVFIAIISLCCCFSSCAYSDIYHEGGVWYCCDLDLEINLDTLEGKYYLDEENFLPVEICMRKGHSLTVNYYDEAIGESRCVYEGYYQTPKNNEFVVNIVIIANPIDPYNGYVIEMNNEYVFTLKDT